MNEFSVLGGLISLVILVDLILVGVWLFKRVTEKGSVCKCEHKHNHGHEHHHDAEVK